MKEAPNTEVMRPGGEKKCPFRPALKDYLEKARNFPPKKWVWAPNFVTLKPWPNILEQASIRHFGNFPWLKKPPPIKPHWIRRKAFNWRKI